MFEAMITALLLFGPGSVLFFLPQLKSKVPFSNLERVLIGTLVWLSFFVFLSYVMSIISAALPFFVFFSAAGTVILVYGAIEFLRSGREKLYGFKVGRDNIMIVVVLAVLPLLVLSLILAQTVYLEYDAIFYYFPLAKSIVLTGGLQYDFFHQSAIMTTTEPAVPLMYAFAGFMAGNPVQYASASSLIPFAFILLTALTVYLTAKEIFSDAVVGLAAAGAFLAMPITSAMASHYAFYLDVSFTFFMALVLFTMVKVYKTWPASSIWWPVLGITLAISTMDRDLMFFLLPCVAAIMLVPILKRSLSRHRLQTLLGLSIIFTASYNFFFLLDLRSSTLTLGSTLIRELPVIFVILVFMALAAFPIGDLTIPNAKNLLLSLLPMFFPILFVARNISAAGAITSNLPLFNKDWQVALNLMSQAGRPSTANSNLAQLFHWNTLLFSLQAGGAIIIPLLIGFAVVVLRVLRRSKEHDRTPFFLLSFLLAMLLMWSWVFGSSYQGSELRRLYYFAPILAIFAGAGMISFAKYLGLGQIRLRVALFSILITSYFWFYNFGTAWDIVKIAYAFDALGSVNVTLFIVFSAFFILSFYPSPHLTNLSNVQRPIRRTLPYIAAIFAIGLIILSCSFVCYHSAELLADQSQTSEHVPSGWENDLSSVISYLDQNQSNSGSIIATYALPIAYFTSHPVIDVTSLPGILDLLHVGEGSGNLTNDLLDNGVRYLLLPTTRNNFFNYTQNLGSTFSVLSPEFFAVTPDIVLLQNFRSFDLYELVPAANLSNYYSYLYTSSNQWFGLDSSTEVVNLSNGVSVVGGNSNNLTIAKEDQSAFWTAAAASSADSISTSSDYNMKVIGNSSLRIQLDGMGNMVIDHQYKTPQDWGEYSYISFYFYGANTSKAVTLTFHTNGWQDYFVTSFRDNFVGWREMQLPLNSFVKYGSPTWSSISFIEFLMGGRTATYWLSDLSVQGYWLGVTGDVPPLVTEENNTRIAVSIGENTASSQLSFVVNSTNGVFEQELSNGLNFITIPSSYLSPGASIEIFRPSLTNNDEFTMYYFGVLSPTR